MYCIRYINPYSISGRTKKKTRNSWDKAINTANQLENNGFRVIDIDME